MRFMIGQTKVARRRVAGIVLAVASLALVGIAVAAPPPPASMALNLPASGAEITQNDQSLSSRCPANANSGYGFVIDFSWINPQLKGLKRYELVLQHGTATPALDVIVAGTSFQYLACNAFVIDGNTSGWQWQVSALNNGKKVIALSEQRPLSFGLCRVSGLPCSAP